MGIYERHVLPRLMDRACGTTSVRQHRDRVCAGLHGRVLEIGLGSGHNLASYPPAVTDVAAVEPSDVAWRLAGDRVAASAVPVDRIGLDGAAIALADDTCDTALSTWTLCTIPDVDSALSEIRRVLRPGGALHFLEHGHAPDASVRRWQRRLEPVQKRVVGGCHLTRPIVGLLGDAGFEVREVDVFYERGLPKVVAAYSLGVAVSP